jgi:DNA-directed RNA polymerase specialized sigma24 family protein
MPSSVNPSSSDSCLAPFLGADTRDQAAATLEQVLGTDITDLVRTTVAHTLGTSRRAQDHLEDVVGDVRLRLVQKLWSLRAGAGEPIDNFRGYCVTTAEHACYAFLRRQFPERTRFRNRLRYALTHHPRTALIAGAQGTWMCQATGARRLPSAGSAQSFLDGPRTFIEQRDISLTMGLPAMAAAILACCDQPVEFDRFVDVMATLLGVIDVTPASGPADPAAPDPLQQIPDAAPTISEVLEHRTELLTVWRELAALPVRQRSALLLNLRDPDGGSMLQLLPTTGLVSRPDIAVALDITLDELNALWDTLPLDDLVIAHRLGLTRQQVINLRKSGRARLARRTADTRR